MKKRFFAALLAAMVLTAAFAQDFPAYLKMKGTVITGYVWDNLPDNLVIPEGVTEIGDWALSGCPNLKSVVIPRGVTVIKYNAFDGCTSLNSVTLPRSVTTIEFFAFEDCGNLTVQYDGTKAQWEAIAKGGDIGSFAVRCSDGEFSKQEWYKP